MVQVVTESAATAAAPPQQWLKIQDVVRLSCMSRAKIYNEMAAGKLQGFRVGKALRFLPADVASWQSLYCPRMQQQAG